MLCSQDIPAHSRLLGQAESCCVVLGVCLVSVWYSTLPPEYVPRFARAGRMIAGLDRHMLASNTRSPEGPLKRDLCLRAFVTCSIVLKQRLTRPGSASQLKR
jgi:hypothetical protein